MGEKKWDDRWVALTILGSGGGIITSLTLRAGIVERLCPAWKIFLAGCLCCQREHRLT